MVRKQQKPLKAKIAPDHPFFELIEEAYRVFDYPTPESTDVCTNCCMEPQIEADFFNPPIRELPLHYVWDWYHGAYPTEGVSKETWGYLLPRLLEILAAECDLSSVGPEIGLKRFPTGDRRNWSDAEWRILDQFQRAYLRREVLKPETEISEYLDDYLCMFALGGWPLSDLTDQIWALPNDLLAFRLWHDWSGGSDPARGEVWLTTFWEDDMQGEVYRFYTSPDMQRRMEQLALSDDTPKDTARHASVIEQIIAQSPEAPAEF